MGSMAEEILREILLKLPTWDVGRCRCVSKQWHGLLTDPTFLDQHVQAAHVVSGSGAEALIVTEIRAHGIGLKMVVLKASSAKAICHITELSVGYHPASTCNGFLLLPSNVLDWPVFVCNPITGQKLKIPAPPAKIRPTHCHTYALGFSPYTRQYKLFRLSFEDSLWCLGTFNSYTLGDHAESWRQHPRMFLNRAAYYSHWPPPALVDGRLYVLTKQSNMCGVPNMILVIDVAREVHFTYTLPEEFTRENKAEVQLFEMCGRLCVSMRFVGRHRFLGRHVLHFWVMQPQGLKDTDEGMLHVSWELRYTFYMNDARSAKYNNRSSGAWFDGCDGMLCYILGDCLYKYDTTKDDGRKKKPVGDFSEWDHQIQLPVAPSNFQLWNVYGGYRPSLLSPHHLAFMGRMTNNNTFSKPWHRRCDANNRQRNCALRAHLIAINLPVCAAKSARERKPQ